MAKYGPRRGPAEIVAEGYRNQQVTIQQMGLTIKQLFAERDALLLSLRMLTAKTVDVAGAAQAFRG